MARTFCLLIPFLLFGSDEFVFWAKFQTQNGLITSQKISISKSMLESEEVFPQLCELKIKKNQNQTILNLLNEHQNELLDCFIGSKSQIMSFDKFKDNRALTKSELILMPRRFRVEIKPHSVIIKAHK